MNRLYFFSFLSIALVVLSIAQPKKKNILTKSVTALSFVVNSPAQTSAWDNPDTENIDESMDGVCQDASGNCTITAATEEAQFMDEAVTITFASSMTISIISASDEPLGELGTLPIGSKIIGGDKNITITGIPFGGPLDLTDNCEISGIKFNNIPVTMGSGNVITGCTFENTGSVPFGLISIDGSNNIIGGLNVSDRNIFKNGKSYGIAIAHANGEGNNQILGNYIGVNESGTSANGNATGILVAAEAGEGNNRIEGNVISGNTSNGISVTGSDNNIIRNNKIGTDANAAAAVGNKQNGIALVNASHTTIEQNVISGNILNGILLLGDDNIPTGSSFNTIKFNFIGVNKDTIPIPNNNFGIQLTNNSNENIIGSTLATDLDTNVIAYNSKMGIAVWSDGAMFPKKNIFRRNRMYRNGNPGITLIPGSQDTIQPAIIDSLKKNGAGELIVYGSGRKKSVADIYTTEPNIGGTGEGKQWLAKGPINDTGYFAVNVGAISLNCDFITALQTDENNNTSANANNEGLSPNITSLTQSCEPSLFGTIPYADNKYTVHIDWNGMPKQGEIEFTLNGFKKTGTLNGDNGEVEYNMSQTIVGTNTLTWKLTTCNNRLATGVTMYQFCGNSVPSWLEPVTAMCEGGHMKYSHLETFPDVQGIAAGMGIPPSIAFVGGLVLSFAGAPTFTTTLNIPGESTPIAANTSFKIGDFGVNLSVSGTASTTFASCNDVDLTGTITMAAGVSKDFTYGFSLGTLPCPSEPGRAQLCQIANSLANVLRVGATLSGEISGTATLAEGIEITGGSGGATLALTPFLDIATIHASGTGQVTFSFEVPSFSVTNVDASVTVTISESISRYSQSWTFPQSSSFVIGKNYDSEEKNIVFAKVPYKPFNGKSVGVDTTVQKGIAWNAKPAFAVGPNNTKAFAWVSYRMSDANTVSDIAIKCFNGIEWSSAIAVTNDDNVDRNPAIVFDNSGNIVVSWERNTSAQAIPDSLQYSSAVMKNFNIMFSVRSSVNGSQIGTGTLGNVNTYDALPKLAKGKDGNIMLAWQVGNGENLFGTDAAPMQLVVAHQWNGMQWISFDTIPAAQSKMFQWDFAVHDGQNAILALAKDTQDDLSTGNDWEIFTIRKANGVWNSVQQLTTNAILEYGVNAAFAYDGTPIVTWMRDTSIIGSFGAVSASQEIWIPKAGMGFFNNSFAVGKDTMVLMWNEGTSAVMSMSSVTQRKWSVPKFAHFTTDIQRSLSAQFATNGSLHIGYQQSPYNTLPNQFSDSGSLQLISIEKVSSPLGVNTPKEQTPKQFALLNAYPNPFNASATIKFVLPKQAYSVLTVTNILGREVTRLVDGVTAEGEHTVVFNADRLASGVYFYTLRSGDIIQTKKLMLVK